MINHDVPFFANTPDDTHCFQASLKMVLKYFWPEKGFSWEELEHMTAKVEGLYTWQYAGLLWLNKNGFNVKNIELMDSARFADEGYGYLVEFYGKERAEANRIHSNLDQERELAKVFVEKKLAEARIPDADDIRRLLQEGFLVMCGVNARTLNDKDGYAGHSVVVKGFDEQGFIVHDPGLPSIENRKIDFETFEKAWSYPTERSKNVIAIKPQIGSNGRI